MEEHREMMDREIDKAIKLLNCARQGWPTPDTKGGNEKYYKALEMGIEALKALKRVRRFIAKEEESIRRKNS